MKYLLSAVMLLMLHPAIAAETNVVEKAECELTCSYADRAGQWDRIVTCISGMDAKQCRASADNRNLNDSYPHKMKCEAQLVANCTERRE